MTLRPRPLFKKCHIGTSSESKPRKIGDPEVDVTRLRVDIACPDFQSSLKRVGMSQKDFSKFTKTPYDTVRSWVKGEGKAQGSALTVLAMLERDSALASACRMNGWEPLW